MKAFRNVLLLLVVAAVGSGAGALAGRWWTLRSAEPATPAGPPGDAAGGRREVLYWYDPMVPQHRFDRPGKSPFMDMALVPRYADEVAGAADTPGLNIPAAQVQRLGLRTAPVTRVAVGVPVEADRDDFIADAVESAARAVTATSDAAEFERLCRAGVAR